MKMSREWAMPSADTFDILPIKNFVKKYLKGISVDPFARNKNWYTYSNDLNPETEASYHMDAEDFLIMLKNKNVKADIVIFDPPYSSRQISECYQSFGKKVTMQDTQLSLLHKNVRNKIDEILKPNGIVLSFGWNSVGMGIKRYYQLEEILLVCHGGVHNDTICLAERKLQGVLFE